MNDLISLVIRPFLFSSLTSAQCVEAANKGAGPRFTLAFSLQPLFHQHITPPFGGEGGKHKVWSFDVSYLVVSRLPYA